MLIKEVWRHTWAEVLEFAKQGVAVNSHTGHLICSQDRKLDTSTGWNLYIHSVKWASKNNKDIPAAVLESFEEDGGNGLAPKRAEHIKALGIKVVSSAHNAHDTVRAKPVAEVRKVVLNRKGKPFSWSFSAINDYLICARKWAGSKFYCDVPFQDSEALRWGNVVHGHLEDRITKGTPLPEAIKDLEKYPAAFLASGGRVVAEQEFAVNRDWELVGYYSKGPKGAWGRCKVDVHIDLGKHVPIYDYKTGKVSKRESDLQLDISALFISLVLPDAEIYIPKFIYTAHDVISPSNKVIQRGDLPGIKAKVEGYLERMQTDWDTESFDCTPNGLCRQYCGVHSCEHNGNFGR